MSGGCLRLGWEFGGPEFLSVPPFYVPASQKRPTAAILGLCFCPRPRPVPCLLSRSAGWGGVPLLRRTYFLPLHVRFRPRASLRAGGTRHPSETGHFSAGRFPEHPPPASVSQPWSRPLRGLSFRTVTISALAPSGGLCLPAFHVHGGRLRDERKYRLSAASQLCDCGSLT